MSQNRSKNRSFLPGIHAFRGLAALLVVMHHGYRSLNHHWEVTPVSEWFIGGAAGVQFFFVLSGFIIYYIHSKDSPTKSQAGRFLKKRLVRIYPIYWVVLFPVLGLLFIQSSFVPELERSVSMVVKNVLLLPSSPRVIAVAWTLSHEMLFYLAFLLFFYVFRSLKTSMAIWGLIILTYQYYIREVGDGSYFLDFVLNLNNLYFFFGILSYDLYSKMKKRLGGQEYLSSHVGLGLVGLAGFIMVLGWSSSQGFVRDYSSWSFVTERTLFALFSVSLIVSEPFIASFKFVSSSFFRILGDASYSIYLCHSLVQTFLDKVLLKLGFQWLSSSGVFLMLIVVPVLAGIVLHYAAEKPLIRLFGKRLYKRS